jgi:nucleotide-binding universal stress UspA family protein
MADAGNVVVVGVDGSADSTAALSWALAFAGEHGSALRLVHAWNPTAEPGVGTAAEEAAARTERLLHALGGMPANVEAMILPGRPGEVLVESSRDALLLVVGASGGDHRAEDEHSGPVGATARHVSRNAGCPVTVIGQGRPTPARS